MKKMLKKLLWSLMRLIGYVYVCVVVFPAVLVLVVVALVNALLIIVAEWYAAYINRISGKKKAELLRDRIADVLQVAMFGDVR